MHQAAKDACTSWLRKPAPVDREALPKKLLGRFTEPPAIIEFNSNPAELRRLAVRGSCRAALQNKLYAGITGARFNRHVEVCASDDQIQAH